jgi:methionine--tRNA ligase beta chain
LQILALKEKYGGKVDEEVKESSIESNFSLEMLVGKIIKVEAHPSADHLYVLDISFGSSARQVVSGLVKHYKQEELLGKFVIVLGNLKASNFKGVKSHGMVLCGQEGESLGLLTVPGATDEILGAKVLPQGLEFNNGKFTLIDSKKLKTAMKKVKLSVGDSGTVLSDTAILEVVGGKPIFAEKVNKGASIA